MRILFIGCVESSYILLKRLLEAGADIVGVITKKESEFNSDFVDLTPLCDQYQIESLCVRNINDSDSICFMRKCVPDIGFCFGWSQLIKAEFLSGIPCGVAGFHPAKLPDNRGRHPIVWALVLGLRETASTFFLIDAEADTGDIVSQRIVDIAYEDDAQSLYRKIMNVAQEQVIEVWTGMESNSIERVKQNPGEGNTWRKRGKKDGEIDWRMSGRSIYNLVRGLTKPYVGAHFVYKDREIKVWRAEEINTDLYQNAEPGKVLSVSADGHVDVKSGDNVIRLLDYDAVVIKEGEYL